MDTCRNRLLALVFLWFLVATAASAQQPGRDYFEIVPPQPGAATGRIEVTEYFSFACSHCRELEPHLQAWRATLPKDVVLVRLPVGFGRPEWNELARLYLTLDALGLAEKLLLPVYSAVHVQRVNLADEKTRAAWLARHGVDAARFSQTSRSFVVAGRWRLAEEKAVAHKVESVPLIVVAGRYVMNGAVPPQRLFENTDLVIAKVREEAARK
ncbi:MAG TPA: thiol:disulfide interchange protein DsbA/DsbL [Usitatibacter sp.]|nr:thiol:disulfide interchange protein DsbA/DsbL [Usitatibacter sp.]